MAARHDDDILMAIAVDGSRWKRRLILIAVPIVAALLVFVVFWKVFFRYVPPGQMLVVISKNGDPLPTERVLAEKGEKGIQKEVLGEGYHFVWPIIYTTELHKNTVIPPQQRWHRDRPGRRDAAIGARPGRNGRREGHPQARAVAGRLSTQSLWLQGRNREDDHHRAGLRGHQAPSAGCR